MTIHVPHRAKLLASVAVLFVLAGCATEPIRNYSAKTGDASLVMRSSGAAAVRYSLSSSAGTCGGFEYVGLVNESTYGLPRSWLASMPEKIPEKFRQAKVPTGTELRIKAYATATRGDASCGPLVATFEPEAERAYAVEYRWLATGCHINVSDITEADNPKPVATKLRVCPNPASAASLFQSKDGHVSR
jgi:hypothetical protein